MGVIERMSIIPYYYLNSQPKLEYGLVFCHWYDAIYWYDVLTFLLIMPKAKFDKFVHFRWVLNYFDENKI
jgi:hypothetical protein